MIYTASITTPKNTLLSSVKETVLKVTKGLIFRFDVQFPPGPCGLLHVAIFDGSYQVWPSTPGEWFTSDDMPIGYDDLYFKNTEPFEFIVKTYNEDDTYEHWTQVRLAGVSKEVYMARFIPSMAWKDFVDIMKRIEQQQIEQREAVLASPFPWITVTEGE